VFTHEDLLSCCRCGRGVEGVGVGVGVGACNCVGGGGGWVDGGKGAGGVAVVA
jgi:hypothetical protein